MVKKKNHIDFRRATWILLLLCSIVALIVLKFSPFVPFRWWVIAVLIVAILLLYRLLLSTTKKRYWFSKITIGLNLIFSACLIVVSIFLPYIKGNIEGIFKRVTEQSTMINVYALTSEYKSAHKDVFKDTNFYDDILNYKDKTFLSQTSSSLEDTKAGLEAVQKKIGTIKLLEKSSPEEAAAALYSNQGQALVLSENVANLLASNEKYKTFLKDTKVVYSFKKTEKLPEVKRRTLQDGTFSLYVAGSDTRSGKLSLKDRFDVNMIVTVNPKTHQILITSIPRDSLVPNLALGGGKDKLTHLGVQGVQNTTKSLNRWLNMEIDNYAIVNFVTFSKIIDALGGIDVDNPYKFVATNAGGYTYPKGKIHLNGAEALGYVRERYSLKDGDFGRGMHQTLVLNAIIRKVSSPSAITKFPALMNSLSGSLLTDADINYFYQLGSETLAADKAWDIINYRITGSVGMFKTASMPSTPLSCVFPNSEQVAKLRQMIQDMENNKVIQNPAKKNTSVKQ
ncbi:MULTISPECIES: LCP family protein [Terrabacteria group]|uniref:LCP family protein n=1 Tax=Bacillati TaxID=1783272 RepID=UPI001C6EB093|nr:MULTISPECIES: LCP family protein [Terrabacteria group]MBW9211934.1 LCP family protein [Trueperella sp. zg.1013]